MARLFDADVRERIRRSLDETLIVEAAAGTGKTTELVERIVNVLAAGLARVSEIVAVTFTEKAAGELKLRLRERLERERHGDEGPPVRRANVERALAGLEEAHVNTIHGFCADLLRERPVEADVDPAFEVLVEGAAERLYARVFDTWLQARLADPPASLRRALHRSTSLRDGDDARGPMDRLRRCGWELVEWRDFAAPWTRDATFDRAAAIDQVRIALQELARLTASPARTTDTLFIDTRPPRDVSADLDRMFEQGPVDLDEAEGRLVSLAKDRQLRATRPGRGAEFSRGTPRAAVIFARDRTVAALADFADRADADLAAGLQQDLADTVALYELAKARQGRLDFLDLLLRARNLLRHHGDVRRDLQRRFTRIFVDEFQDTDPIQAEVLLLLASDDPSVEDWRQTRPRPGALFIVADPKQSIYRFRRADVGIYDEVKQQLRRCGIGLVHLSTSFRSLPSLQTFVNGAFAPLMRGDSRTQQAEYVPLRSYRFDRPQQPSVIALPVPRPYGRMRVAAPAIEQSLPVATAAFVHWLLNESRWTVTERTPRTGEDVRVPIAARHVCLLFRRFESWNRDVTRPYVEALEARNVPHLLVGGRSFDQREEVETMTAALAAIEWPDDELSVFATLRGSLFAVSDATLLAYRHQFGRFHPFTTPSDAPSVAASGSVDDVSAPDCGEVLDAMAILRRLHLGRNRTPVSATIAALLDATRAHAGFALRPSGEQALANVLHIAELARRYESAGGLSFRGFVEELRDGRFGDTTEAPILEEGGDGVRIMTVHRAKGLEFPVVVLADMTTKSVRPQADRFLDSARELCALRVLGCAPHDLLAHEGLEIERNSAEAVRVAYVAATRARDLLVVPALGDGPYEGDRWLAALSPMLYPAADARRQPDVSPGCPAFGRDSVVERPDNDPATHATVAPGLHRIRVPALPDGEASSSDSCPVVWWDPHVLSLDVRRSFGLRQTELIGKDADPVIVNADLAAFRAWADRRDATLARGRVPSVVIETVRQRAARLADAPPLDVDSIRLVLERTSPSDVAAIPVIDAVPQGTRAGGQRYGTLIHEVVAAAPLTADVETVGALAAMRGRALGATAEEVASATAAVTMLLAHDIMTRARRAETSGLARRETPVSFRAADGTLIEGVVDLAFEESGVWQVVDFKTDRDIEAGLHGYRWQVALYAEAIARATGKPARGVLVRL
jgi:ATP-dependent exoDNAse (exonuclease V) beta subunit